MKLVNWNIEWMNNWFEGYGKVKFRQDYPEKGLTDINELCMRVASVIKQLDPDVLTVEEGPSDIREMELFVDKYLKKDNSNSLFYIFGGFGKRDQQRNYALVKKTGKFRNPNVSVDKLSKELEEPWIADVDGDLELTEYNFTRVPLVIEGQVGANNSKIKIITLHSKSKYVNRGKSLWRSEDESKRRQYIRLAIKNRKRIATEAMRIRNYMDELLNCDPNSFIIVNGDFNDGPSLDYFEKYYIYQNVTDILLGSTFDPEKIFSHAFIHTTPKDQRYTVTFEDFVDETRKKSILLDHILVSPGVSDSDLVNDSGIAHEIYEKHEKSNASERETYPSDHRPIFAEFDF